MQTAIRHQFAISSTVDSSAIDRIALVPAADNSDAYDLEVTYTSSDKVYTFAVEDDAFAEKVYDLLTDEEAKAETSWGRLIHAALKHGDIETIEV